MAFVAMAALAVTTGLYAFLIGPLLAFLFTGESHDAVRVLTLIPTSRDSLTWARDAFSEWLPIAILIVAALKGLAYFFQMRLMAQVGVRLGVMLRQTLFERVMAAERDATQTLRRGDLATRFGDDVDVVRVGLIESLTALVRDGATLVVLMALAISLDGELSLLAFVVMPVAIVPMIRLGRRLRRAHRSGADAQGSLAAQCVDVVSHLERLPTRAEWADERRRFAATAEAIRVAQLRAVTTRAINHPIMEFLGVGGLALTLWYAAARIEAGSLTPEAFVSFFAALLMLYEPMKGLSRANSHYQSALAGWDRLLPLWSLPAAPSGERTPGALIRGLCMRDVRVSYGDRTILESVSWTMGPGETWVISGPSGGGKSSLLRVLTGLRRASAGVVCWNDQPLERLDRYSLAERMAYVDQDARMLGRSIRDNLTLGAEVSEAALWRALEAADAAASVLCLIHISEPTRPY